MYLPIIGYFPQKIFDDKGYVIQNRAGLVAVQTSGVGVEFFQKPTEARQFHDAPAVDLRVFWDTDIAQQ
jgi:hypothetical protein